MKTSPTRRWLALGALGLLGGLVWFGRPLFDSRAPKLDVSPLLKAPSGTVAVSVPTRAHQLNKSLDMLDKARAAHANPRSPEQIEASRDAAARQILAGLKPRLSSEATRNSPPLTGKVRGTGRQVLDPAHQEAVDDLAARLGPGGTLQMDSASGTLRHLRGDLSSVVADDPAFAEARMRQDFGGMALATLTPLGRVMNIQKPQVEFVPETSKPDDLGMVHVRMNQQYHGLPIEGAQVIVHFNAKGEPVEIGGTYAATPAKLGVPEFKLEDEAVITRAQAAVNASGPGIIPPKVRRAFYWNPEVSPVPAYLVDLVPSVSESWRVVLAADDGRVLRRLPTMYRAAGTGQSVDLLGQSRPVHCWQDGSEYLAIDTSLSMYDTGRSRPPVYTNTFGAICIFDVKDADVDEALKNGISYARSANLNQWDPTAVSMMTHFVKVFGYYQSTHNRTSFDGKGINITGLIHCRFKNNQGQLYKDNAFFNPNLNLMIFGDGENATKPGMLPAALDIVAHELSHGVVDNSAAFRYENQSGALHEHMADYFACMIDREDWLLGEDTLEGTTTVAWRDMSDPHNPKLKESGPKTMAEYKNLPNTPEGDLGGVHVNSTIPSHATYLFTDGPNGMGREKSERIVYRALTQYMTQYAGFVDYRRALLSAAADLYPGGAEAAVIAQAFDNVQIMEGEAAPAPTPVPATSGEERVVFLRAEFDEWFGDFIGYGLYAMNAQNYALVSMNVLSPVRPAVSGDGTWALYVDEFNDVYWTDGETDEPLTDTGDIRTIAMSKDLRYVAFTTTDYDNQIHFIDTQDSSVSSAEIEVSNRSGDENSVSYADVLSFNCLGDSLYFDAWTEGTLGQTEYGCWGLFSVRVKDRLCQSILPLSPGLQVGNPSLAHTLPSFLVADYIYTENGESTLGVVSIDLGRSELNVLLSGLNVLAVPTLRGDDKKLVFESYNNGLYYLNEAPLPASGTAIAPNAVVPLLWSATELGFPVGFRSGSYTPPAGRLELSQTSLDFGTVTAGTVANRTLELHNSGNADLELIGITVEGAGASSFNLGGAVEKRMAAGQRQQVQLAFVPANAGAQRATLHFQSTAPQQADVTLEVTGSAEAGTPHDYWREVWQQFEDKYSYFDYKQVNWASIYETRRQEFQGLNATQFGQKLNEVLQVLHDWHVYVRLPDGTYIGYNGNYPLNCSENLFARYVEGGGNYVNVRNANVVYHARLAGNFAHIVIDTLDTGRFSSVTDADIDQIFVQYADTDGIVLDIRNNSGGNEANASRFASRFTTQPRPFGYVRYRQPGSKPYAFDALMEKVLQPAATGQYLKPVAGLIGQRCMSSAEWFTLMLKVCPNAVLIGDRTRGASGNPETFTLPDLGIEYSVCRWIAYDDQQQPFEDRGLAPAISIDPRQSVDDNAQRDYVLEKAIAYLQWRRQLGDKLPQVSGSSDRDQDGRSDIAEYLAGTDPVTSDGAFGFDRQGIRVISQGIELRWKSVAGQKFHLHRATSVLGPFTRLAGDIASTPPANTYRDTAVTGSRTYFYRLELAP